MMKRVMIAAAVLAAGAGLAGCADEYGYGGVGVGYSSYYPGDYGYAGYYDDYYGGYGAPYFGWYDGFYYPGTGVYVYDRYRRPYRWSDAQRHHWEGRRGYGYANGAVRGNWREFRGDVREDRQAYRGDLRADRQAYQAGTITQDQFRADRRDARQDYRGAVRQDYQDLRQENRDIGVGTPRLGRGALRNGGRFGPRGRR